MLVRRSKAGTSKRQMPRRALDRGFTLVEMMVASALALIVMSVAFAGIVESQRTINTTMARNSDDNAAQSIVDRIELAVRSATSVGVMCWSGSAWSQCSSAPATWQSTPSTELWIYSSSGATACTAWILTGSASGYYLEFATGAHSATSTPTIELYGVTAGSFTYFSSFSGLIDINLEVRHAGSSSANGYEEQSAPSQIEAEADDPNMSGAVTSGYPGTC